MWITVRSAPADELASDDPDYRRVHREHTLFVIGDFTIRLEAADYTRLLPQRSFAHIGANQ